MIDEKYLKQKMYFLEDYMIYFLLVRNAYNYLEIEKIFYIKLRGWNITDKNVVFRTKKKFTNINYKKCDSFLNFIEFILYQTENNFFDKKIAFFSLNKWLLSGNCRNFSKSREKAIFISKQYLDNKFIRKKNKNLIKIFLDENKNNTLNKNNSNS